MIANNIITWIGDLFTNVLFLPLDWIRGMDNWWAQNLLSWIFILITGAAIVYWIGQIKKFGKEEY